VVALLCLLTGYAVVWTFAPAAPPNYDTLANLNVADSRSHSTGSFTVTVPCHRLFWHLTCSDVYATL